MLVWLAVLEMPFDSIQVRLHYHRTRSLHCCCCCRIAAAALLLLHAIADASAAAAAGAIAAALAAVALRALGPSHSVSLQRKKCRKVLRSLRHDERSIAALLRCAKEGAP